MQKFLVFTLILFSLAQNVLFSTNNNICQNHFDCHVGELCDKQVTHLNGYGSCKKIKGTIKEPKVKYEKIYIPPLSKEEYLEKLQNSEKEKKNVEQHTRCGNEDMHYQSPFKRLKTCAIEVCDDPNLRNNYTALPNKTFKIFWMVFHCTGQEYYYQNAYANIAAAHGTLNNIYSAVGYQFVAYISYYPCTGTAGNQNYSSFDSAGNNVITAVNTEIGTNYQNNGGFVIVSGVPQDPTLNGFMFLPLTGYSYHGIGFMSIPVITASATTLPHEMGHAFGLYHTFKGVSETPDCSCAESTASDYTGDFCADTPSVARNWECASPISTSTYPDPCTVRGSQWDPNPYTNLMSYGTCRILFTDYQMRRIRCYQVNNLPWLMSLSNFTQPAQPNPTPQPNNTNPNPTPNNSTSINISLIGIFLIFLFFN